MSSKPVRHKATVHHPLTGWGRRPSALPGIAPSADGALGRLGYFARCGGRVFRAVRGAGVSPAATGDQRLCLWKPRFGQRAAGWQEVSARNFVSEQGPVSPPYWMYGKKLGRSYGAKGPATPADTPVVSCPIEKNRVKLLFFCAPTKKRTRCRSSASLFIQFTASWNSPAATGQPEHG